MLSNRFFEVKQDKMNAIYYNIKDNDIRKKRRKLKRPYKKPSMTSERLFQTRVLESIIPPPPFSPQQYNPLDSGRGSLEQYDFDPTSPWKKR